MKRQTPPTLTYLHPDVAQQVTASAAKHQKLVRHYAHKHQQRQRWICIIGLFFVVALGIQSIRMYFSLTENQQKLVQTRQTYETAQATQKKLTAQTENLKNEAYLQQIMREKYGYSKDDETIYRLPVDQ